MNISKHHLQLTFYKSYAEIRAEATRAYLGFAWWFFEPLIYLVVFYLIFESGLRGGGPDFVPFLLCGLVVWKWFASTVLGGAGSLSKNAGIIQQVYLPKIILPMVQVITNTLKFSVIFLILLLFLVFVFDKPPSTVWFALPLLIFVQLILVGSLTSLIAAVVPFAQDLRLLLDNFVMMLFFLSGIFYDINKMDAEISSYFSLNPMAVLINNYRMVLLHDRWPDWIELAQVLGGALVLFILALFMFKKFDRIYPKLVT